ncbi:MAG: Asp-tRNA(Asn)/Glu-tRNA(Gln) amidotransferase subunit GatC [Spirochaetales bacterium]|nr:Asp-tRNA(Asn)/Glu-tRNA(Gln) amidotransferase subunit GatC [Spirochaetales bacterium]
MNKEELLTTASLALLELEEGEVDRLGEEIARMLDYFEMMTKLDVDGLEPTTHAFQKTNRLRADVLNNNNNNNINNAFNRNLIMENGNDVEDDFFVIPNVL